jgi:hypothetical protein
VLNGDGYLVLVGNGIKIGKFGGLRRGDQDVRPIIMNQGKNVGHACLEPEITEIYLRHGKFK